MNGPVQEKRRDDDATKAMSSIDSIADVVVRSYDSAKGRIMSLQSRPELSAIDDFVAGLPGVAMLPQQDRQTLVSNRRWGILVRTCSQ